MPHRSRPYKGTAFLFAIYYKNNAPMPAVAKNRKRDGVLHGM